MKPEDYIDEIHVPAEEEFSPEKPVDEKVKLRKSIKRYSCIGLAVSLIFITLVVFITSGTNYYTSNPYIERALDILYVFFWGYSAYVYYRILRAPTAKEMQHFHNRLGHDSIFAKTIVIALALYFGAAFGLYLLDYNIQWYVVLLAAIMFTAFNGMIFWAQVRYGDSPLEDDIHDLLFLEEEDNKS